MFCIECHHLEKEKLQSESLKAVEQLCEQFHLQDAFGIISTSLYEILDRISLLSKDEFFETSLTFLVEHSEVTVRIEHSESLDELQHLLSKSDFKTESSSTIISSLTDQIEFLDDNKSINMSFHVKPYLQERKEDNLSDFISTTKEIKKTKN